MYDYRTLVGGFMNEGFGIDMNQLLARMLMQGGLGLGNVGTPQVQTGTPAPAVQPAAMTTKTPAPAGKSLLGQDLSTGQLGLASFLGQLGAGLSPQGSLGQVLGSTSANFAQNALINNFLKQLQGSGGTGSLGF